MVAHTLALIGATLSLSMSNEAIAQGEHVARPHDIAVQSGDVITTSLGTDSVAVIYDGAASATYIDVGGHSWGVCFADTLAYVTLPGEDYIAVVDLSNQTYSALLTVPLGCTEIIADDAGETLYVANVGRSIESAESDKWKHSILVIDISDATPDTTMFSTERQPRALALCPDEDRLFVGTVQGALGQDGITSTHSGTGFRSAHDGGSIIVHNLESSGNPAAYRFSVGSPVRGIAALPDTLYSPSSYSGDYRIYFTSVGFGVQSEDPGHGGKVIPNVISSVLMSSSHVPQTQQDAVFKHLSTYSADPLTNDNLPAVLPEQLIAIADDTKAGYDASLWVTNSASGTISRAWITSTGAIATGQSAVSLDIPEVSDVDSLEGSFAFTFSDVPTNYPVIDPATHAQTDTLGHHKFRSRPRSIAFDSTDETVVVSTESTAEVVWFSAAVDTFAGLWPDAMVSVGDVISGIRNSGKGEGNFFTFGEGFNFREVGGDEVDNLSCGTCHVDGHSDGKVRLTVRQADNTTDSLTPRPAAVTAVPSVFDSAASEWIFFEGFRTVIDSTATCTYCTNAKFFGDTPGFAPRSPASPYSGAGSIAGNAKAGLAWMDDMNCTRCHSGSAQVFLRTNDSSIIADKGPLANSSNLLSDPTQSFISNVVLEDGDVNSRRNMTVVGTRVSGSGTIDPADNTHIKGVNTPPLAGAWDNLPYFHDGRYRTLEQVLEHTWISKDLGMRAARVWPGMGIPDNLFDDTRFPITDTELPLLERNGNQFTINSFDVTVHNFKTHSHEDPDLGSGDNWISAKEYLTGIDAYEDVLAALRSFSSELAPFSASVVDSIVALEATVTDGFEVLVEWSTPDTMVCRYTITNDQTSDSNSGWTGPGTSHSVLDTMDIGVEATWKAVVSASYNGQVATDSVTWTTAPAFVNMSGATGELAVASGKTVTASVPLDYTNDGYEDLLISYNDDYAMLFENGGGPREAATFTDRTSVHLYGGTLQDTQGVASADVNGDGFVDLFITAGSSNYLIAGDGNDFDSSQDISDLLGPTESLDAVGASFGDYNGDSWPDLFVMSSATGGGDALLENAQGDSLFDVTSAADLHTGVEGSTSAVWADVDRDGDTDLIVGWGAAVGTSGEWTRYYLNNGESAGQVTFDDRAGASTGPRLAKTGYVEDIELGDVSGDGDVDLLLALSDAAASNTLVGWVNDGDGAFTVAADTTLGLSSDALLTDLELADLNANGVLDVIAVPDGGGTIGVFSGYGEESDREYRDGTDLLDLGTDEAFGVVAADFNRDTDVDLFLMRPISASADSAYFWANALVDSVPDPGEEPAFSIQLRTYSATTDSATTASGATVIVKVTTDEGRVLYSSQVVDGGSGGGGQGSNRLVFGLADASGAEVTVLWPDGSEQVIENVSAHPDFPHIVVDDKDPGIIASSVGATYTAGAGNVIWSFSWKTQKYCSGAKVHVESQSTSGDCLDPLGEQPSKTLNSGDTGVTWTQTAGGTDWQQTLTWTTSCSSSCSYDYTVKSVRRETTYDGPEKTIQIKICPLQFP